MLTLTYALVALSVEQKKIQGRLLELQQSVQKEHNGKATVEQSKAESIFADFVHLDDACQSRNIELYVLPALRSLSSDADSLLAEMDEMASMGRAILKNIRISLRKTATQDSFECGDFFDALEMYCQDLMKRLTMEELHVLPAAQRLISSDEWFDIAAKFISHESEKHPKRVFENELESIMASSGLAAMHKSNNFYQSAN